MTAPRRLSTVVLALGAAVLAAGCGSAAPAAPEAVISAGTPAPPSLAASRATDSKLRRCRA